MSPNIPHILKECSLCPEAFLRKNSRDLGLIQAGLQRSPWPRSGFFFPIFEVSYSALYVEIGNGNSPLTFYFGLYGWTGRMDLLRPLNCKPRAQCK